MAARNSLFPIYEFRFWIDYKDQRRKLTWRGRWFYPGEATAGAAEGQRRKLTWRGRWLIAESPCNKYLISAHVQTDRWDNRDAGKDGADGVQKSDVCCTGFSASTTGLRHLGFLRCSAAPAVGVSQPPLSEWPPGRAG